MALNLSVPEENELRPRITVFGVGGAGGNAVNNMIEKQLEGVEFVVANTDAQALQQNQSASRIQLGVKVTEGLGAGARAEVGAAAAEESIEQIVDHLAGAHMCFITAGMGGGTGTGAAPIIAQAAREMGVLTVGVVTKPFQFEGAKRMRQAEAGVEALQKMVDTLIIIPNQNLFRLANEKTTFTEAFSMADDVLYQGVKGVTDLMVRPGLINLDFADVRAVMDEMGKAMMGTGEASGEGRATQAAEAAINNPLLDDISMAGARAVLINVTGGMDMTLFEVDEAANRIRQEIDADSVIIFGSTFDEKLDGIMRVSIVATGIDTAVAQRETPTFIQAPTTRRSTVISAPTAMAAEPEMPAIAKLPEPPAMPEMPEAARDDSDMAADEPEAATTSQTDVEDSAEQPYVPAFVPTQKKSSRLAFLATGRSGSREFPVPRQAEEPAAGEADETTEAEGQLSLEEAIANERATAFGSGMPADVTDQADAERDADAQATAQAEDGPVMVADTPQELTAPRRAFVPAAPAAMPESELVPETAPAGGKTSLINKISGLWTAKPSDEAAPARREPEVETSEASLVAEIAQTAAPEAAPAILDLPRADAMNRIPEQASTTGLDQQTDDLEIPAFLRRQAN